LRVSTSKVAATSSPMMSNHKLIRP